jgi:carbonic anhydrase/acetyltransferase-like protein (isoleucine patch superfamily)
MRIRHRGQIPVIEASAFVAPSAVLIGQVLVGARSRIMYGAILDAEASHIEIGECCIINEYAVLRATAEAHQHPVRLEDHVLVGPHSFLAGCVIKRCAYVATGVTILYGAVVEAGAAIGVGALIHANTRIPESAFVPPGCVAIGDPVRIYGPNDPELPGAIKSVRFSDAAFGVKTSWEDRITRYQEATEVRSKEFGAHFEDEIIDSHLI